MNSSHLRASYWDVEVSTLTDMLFLGKWQAHEVATIQRQLEDRKAQIMGGLGSATQRHWTEKVQREVDDCCRVRRDPIFGWFLDRWVEDLMCWHPVGYIGTGGRAEVQHVGAHGAPILVTVDDKVRPDLVYYLKSHDMQRPGYLEEKRAASKAVRDANEKAGTEKVLAAVDSLSSKRLKEFIAVERAIQTGETVTMHGPCMTMFDRLTDAGKKAPPGPQSLNPGQHPLRAKRDYSKGEGAMYGFRREEAANDAT